MVPSAALKACPLFQDFTDTGIRILATIAQPRAYTRGATLFREGADGDSLLVIAEGSVRLSARTPAGEEVSLGEVGAGEPLGELGLLRPGPHLCTAQATSDVTAVELRSADFQRLAGERPQACAKLLMSIAVHLGQKLRDNRDALRSLMTRG